MANANDPVNLVKNRPWFKAKIAGHKDQYFWRHMLDEPLIPTGLDAMDAYYAAHESVADAVAKRVKRAKQR